MRVDLFYSAVQIPHQKGDRHVRRAVFHDAVRDLTGCMAGSSCGATWSRQTVCIRQSGAAAAQSAMLKWNVETIGFSPNGFNGYFLFKILLVPFAAW